MPDRLKRGAMAGDGVGALCSRVARRLAEAGIDDPAREARWLVSVALGLEPSQLISDPDRAVAPLETAKVNAWLERRCDREPLWRIVGEREFYGRLFRISPATLEPRPDSETVVEAVLGLVRAGFDEGTPLRLIDVGTGTGCLLITLLAELPQATGVGTDISEDALEVARENARRLGVGARAQWRVSRSLEGIDDTFDVLVSNPPYIPSTEIEKLDPEVRLYDPVTALDGGGDGLEIYREICGSLPDVVPNGIAAFEVGLGQHASVSKLLAETYPASDRGSLHRFDDLSGRIRCVAHSAL